MLRDWRHHPGGGGGGDLGPGLSSDQESYAESTDGWSSANCSTLPPPMNKIPADRYRAPLPGGALAQPHRLTAQKDEWAKKLFGAGAGAGAGAEKGARSQNNGRKRGSTKDGDKKVRRSDGRWFKGVRTQNV